MTEPPFDKKTAHCWFAVELNNFVWDLLEESSWPKAEVMIHAAHAACYHWLQVGKAIHHVRAECLIGNVYATLGFGESATRHAKRCLELLEKRPEEIADWDWAFAYDCMSRAHAAAGLVEEAKRFRQRAREAGGKIANAEDKKFFDQWFKKNPLSRSPQ